MDFGWPIITAAMTGRLLEKKAKNNKKKKVNFNTYSSVLHLKR